MLGVEMFNMFKRATTILSAIAAISAIAIFVAPAASAVQGCASGYQCIYSDDLMQKISLFQSKPDLRYPDGTSVAGNVGLVINASTVGYEAHYYSGLSYTGSLVFCLNPGSLVLNPPDDQIRSLRLRPPTSIPCL
jgi:hypothetical protein